MDSEELLDLISREDGMVVYNLTMPRSAFPDEETYQKALASQTREYAAPTDDIDITGLDKTDVLIALYRPARKVGMGFLSGDLTDDEIRSFVANYQGGRGEFPYIDYLGGKPLKVDLTGDTFNGRLYDRDQGVGAARRAVDGLRHQ
jgi:hypothetical protein